LGALVSCISYLCWFDLKIAAVIFICMAADITSWLNEGWTTYIERRLQAEMHGELHRDFSAIIGWKALGK
jgi:hypothetical protein